RFIWLLRIALLLRSALACSPHGKPNPSGNRKHGYLHNNQVTTRPWCSHQSRPPWRAASVAANVCDIRSTYAQCGSNPM
ncbi:hypothetical protein, partial [Salinimonas chungwhensis]|uniref:hypothetical protein n=1 Tax=Salinimonas chungwhensis TaxID=265425 RepID=UPI001B7FAC76